MSPRVSIVLPTYNGARYLAESVDSCLSQTFADFELIVIVDGSTDDTDQVLSRYHDPRVIVHRQANQGLPASLNNGFALARGELWGWTSDDNAYAPEALRTLVDHLDAHPEAAMACGDSIVIDGRGRATGYNAQHWACFLYRAEAARRTGGYRVEHRLVEDVDFFLRLQHIAGPISRVSRPLYRYRVHPGSLSYKQLKNRHLASLKMHYDLVSRGIERLELRELFMDRLASAAMHRDVESMDAMIAFAELHHVPFLDEYQRRNRELRTPVGWLRNRVRIALRSRAQRVASQVKLWLRRVERA